MIRQPSRRDLIKYAGLSVGSASLLRGQVITARHWPASGGGGGPTITLITHSAQLLANAGSLTFTINDSGANFIAISLSDNAGTTASVSADNLNSIGNWHAGTPYIGSGSTSIQFLYLANATTGASHQITVSGLNFSNVVISAWSNVGTSGQLAAGTEAGNTGAGGCPVAGGTLTPAVGNALILTDLLDNQVSITVPTGYTLVDTVSDLANTGSMHLAYKIQGSSPSAETPTWASCTSAAYDIASVRVIIP